MLATLVFPHAYSHGRVSASFVVMGSKWEIQGHAYNDSNSAYPTTIIGCVKPAIPVLNLFKANALIEDVMPIITITVLNVSNTIN